MAKYSRSSIGDKVAEGSTLLFGDTISSLQHSVGHVEGSSRAKKQLDLFIRFDRTPTCDRQTQGGGIYCTSIESCGNNPATIRQMSVKLSA